MNLTNDAKISNKSFHNKTKRTEVSAANFDSLINSRKL